MCVQRNSCAGIFIAPSLCCNFGMTSLGLAHYLLTLLLLTRHRKRPTKAEKMGLAANKQKNPSRAQMNQTASAGPSKPRTKTPAKASTSILDEVEEDDDMGAGSSSASQQAAAKQQRRAELAEIEAEAAQDAEMGRDASGQPKRKKSGLKAKAKAAAAAEDPAEPSKERPDYVDMFDKSMRPRRRHK